MHYICNMYYIWTQPKNKDGKTMLIKGRENINNYRLIVLKQGLKLEMLGMSRSKGKSCYSIIKEEFNLKGSKKKVFELFSNIIKERQKDESK